MTKRKGWAVGSDHYRNKLAQRAQGPIPRRLPVVPRRLSTTGRVSWDASQVDFNLIPETNTDRSLSRFKHTLPDLIWNVAALEGSTFTLPEVRTLLEGVQVGGKRIEESRQILDLSDAYADLMVMVKSGHFVVSAEVSNSLHRRLAQNEAIEAGHFRGEGSVQGGGHVTLSTGERAEGEPHGDGGELLIAAYAQMVSAVGRIKDPRERALAYFCSAVRSQFYFDGNKRTARLMMSGMLMAAGSEAVSVPYARILEFNNALDELCTTDDATELMRFLVSCVPDNAVSAGEFD